MSDEALVAVGRVVKPHGIRGEVVVDVLSEVEGRLAKGTQVVVAGTTCTVVSSRPHQGRLLCGFSFVADRTMAEGLRGALVEAPGADLVDEDVFYVHELVGAAVRGPDGEDLGSVEGVILLPDAAGYDLLEVTRPDGHRWLLPAADGLVEAEEVAGTDGVEVVLHLVELPEGLVDGVGAAVAQPEPAPSDTAPSDAAPSDAPADAEGA